MEARLAPRKARLALACSALFVGLALLAGCRESNGWPRSTSDGAYQPGRVLYLTYCERCHGVAGRGDGPAAPWLRQRPADLTRLHERYGSPLDRERLSVYIDGRTLVDGHGRRDMPVWGNRLFQGAPPSTPQLESERARLIDQLITHVESLQSAKPGGS